MNMRWYLALFDEAGHAMDSILGLTSDYFEASGTGGFDLEHHLWYPAEVHIGDTVAIRVRFLARSDKLIHYLMFMENETRGVLSSVFECVYAHADLTVRRTSPFPAPIAARIDALIAEHRALRWTAPTSGAMGV
jgi:acyl-CoA thioesterase FadM